MKQHTQKINTTIRREIDGLLVDVMILDVRNVFGRIDYLITPVKGSGTKWITIQKADKLQNMS